MVDPAENPTGAGSAGGANGTREQQLGIRPHRRSTSQPGSPLVRSDGGKHSAPPRHWSSSATKPDNLVEGLYCRSHECAGRSRFLHGGGAYLAGVSDLLCVVFPSSGKPPSQ